MRLPRFLWRLMHLAQVPYARNPRAPIAGLLLLLTTVGRRTGRLRVTPLQYEELGGVYYVGSARGFHADWYRNLIACPQVQLQIGSRQFSARAEPIASKQQIVDYLQLRLSRHPRMVGLMMLGEGMPIHPGREQLERYAERIALVRLVPMEQEVY